MGECIYYCLPKEGNFVIGSKYEWKYIIDGIRVCDEDGNQICFMDYTFMWYFKEFFN